MGWIAKNDITGKTYGKEFADIYECQKFIDTDLVILQYEWRRIAYLEEEEFDEREYQKFYKKNYGKNENQGLGLDILARIEFGITQLGNDNKRSQNVIRCYNTEQKRYARGFDY